VADCEILQTNISLHIAERNIPQPQNLKNFSLFSAAVQKVGVAFKEHNLK
jgi:hypothetical protein